MSECMVIASGPSIRESGQLQHLVNDDNFFKIGVTYATLHIPCDIAVACEQKNYNDIFDRKKVIAVSTDILTYGPALKFRQATRVSDIATDGLFRGSFTGCFALNLALCMFDYVYLFGFDGKGGKDGSVNFFDTMKEKGFIPPASNYTNTVDYEFFRNYDHRIINCNEDSAIDVFPKMDWRKLLCNT